MFQLPATGGSERQGYLPSSKQAQLKLLRAFVIQNTCFVVGIHLAWEAQSQYAVEGIKTEIKAI